MKSNMPFLTGVQVVAKTSAATKAIPGRYAALPDDAFGVTSWLIGLSCHVQLWNRSVDLVGGRSRAISVALIK
jgi:hypothetical protein